MQFEAELTEELRARYGVTETWGWVMPHVVRWSECDLFGHVNHAAYFTWFEDIRTFGFEADGLPRMTRTTPGTSIVDLQMRYAKPLHYADEVLVTGRVLEIRTTSFTMEYGVWRDGLVAMCRTVLVLMINATGEKVPIPDPIRLRWTTRDGARDARAPR